MSYDLVGAMEFVHQLTGKLMEFNNAELVAMILSSLTGYKAIEHASWFKWVMKKVGYSND